MFSKIVAFYNIRLPTFIEILRPEFRNLNSTKRAKVMSLLVNYIELIENKQILQVLDKHELTAFIG